MISFFDIEDRKFAQAVKASLPPQMRICMLARRFPVLGRGAHHGMLWPIARGLAKQGHDVTVVAWRNPQGRDIIQHDGITAYYLGHSTTANIRQFPQLAAHAISKMHLDMPFHVVHSMDSSGYAVARQRRKLKLSVMFDVEATKMSQIFAILGHAQDDLISQLRTGFALSLSFLTTYWGRDRGILAVADGVFVTSPQQKLALERYYLYPEYRTYLVPYGIEALDLSPKLQSEDLRSQLGVKPTATIAATVSDFQDLSEIKSLLMAFEVATIKKPSSHLLIFGDGPLRRKAEYEILSLALGNRVTITGAIPPSDISDHIALADVFINLSARTSGFEPSLLEAMAQKKVVIGSEVSPIANIVDDGVNGFLVRPADHFGIGALLVKIFTAQIPAAKIGENARQKIIKLFDNKKMVAETVAAYQQTLLKSGRYKADLV